MKPRDAMELLAAVHSLIPDGCYCYDERGTCPFWALDGNHDEQDNGFCFYLELGDWEHPGLGLLWDQCKECGIKDDIP